MPTRNRSLGNQFDRTRQYSQQTGPSAMANQYTTNPNGSQTQRRPLGVLSPEPAEPQTIQRQPPSLLSSWTQPAMTAARPLVNAATALPGVFSGMSAGPQTIQRQPPGVFSPQPMLPPSGLLSPPPRFSPFVKAAAGVRTGTVSDKLDAMYEYARVSDQLAASNPAPIPTAAAVMSQTLAPVTPIGQSPHMPPLRRDVLRSDGGHLMEYPDGSRSVQYPQQPQGLALESDAIPSPMGVLSKTPAPRAPAPITPGEQITRQATALGRNSQMQHGLRMDELEGQQADLTRQSGLLNAAHRNPATAVSDGHSMQANNNYSGLSQFQQGGIYAGAQPLQDNQYVTGYGADAKINTLQPRKGWEDAQQQVLARNYTGDGTPGPDGFNVLKREDGTYAVTSQGVLSGLQSTTAASADGRLKFSGDGPMSGFVADPGDFESAGAVPINENGDELFYQDGQWATADGRVAENGPIGRISSFTAPDNRLAAAQDIIRRAEWREANGGLSAAQSRRLKHSQMSLNRAVQRGVLSPTLAQRNYGELQERITRQADARGVLTQQQGSGLLDGPMVLANQQYPAAYKQRVAEDFARMQTGQTEQDASDRDALSALGIQDLSNPETVLDALGNQLSTVPSWDPNERQAYGRGLLRTFKGLFTPDRTAESFRNMRVLMDAAAKVDMGNHDEVDAWLDQLLSWTKARHDTRSMLLKIHDAASPSAVGGAVKDAARTMLPAPPGPSMKF